MRTLALVTAIFGLSILAGCSSGAAPEPPVRAPESARYAVRPATFLATETRTDAVRFKPADLPMAHRPIMRSR